ncbi:hypothetical protein TOT_030000378 [Theileria orientalis strain Shintoku]|uniref:Uncharacterized protein n=1 Tax=Theileria orientalis strain Shintoku TaxID=869250 RepID=J4D904_THEOR|nr:hypothetical protein TOT_030000378 [Theileria orientalis strain Shintoku]BAM41115.1 hypothetical protein TOT_030000378 [Theileria orientalis strain Shintoku]|eukprot:XP_009691416.1 hypothetical protein TOT_030000378 [Theileria orientalis strain Shintoku]
MFNPSPESDVVKKLKSSLKIVDGEDKSEEKPPTEDVSKRKRRHGVGFKVEVPVKRSVEQVKLVSKFKGVSRKKASKGLAKPRSEPTPVVAPEPEPESRLDLIFKSFKRK